MRVAIVGSRNYPDLGAVRDYVLRLALDDIVVSGGATGVDHVAEMAARYRCLPTWIYPADWKRHGKQAGYIRNALIVEAADRVVAFWDGKSRGTAHTVHLAQARGLPVQIFKPGEAP